MKPAKILFFIAGVLPTKEDYEAAQKLGNSSSVVFRNASQVPKERHALENCDGVAGAVPECYAKTFPSAKEAIETNKKEFKKLTDSISDEKPPKLVELTDEQKAQAESDKARADFESGQTGGTGVKGAAPAWNANKQ